MRKIEILQTSRYSEEVIERITAILKGREPSKPFHVFLSGGSTPRVLYSGLAQQDIDWKNIHLWWGDERFVPPDHADSNFRMVKETLLDTIKLPHNQIHPWPILSTPELSASTYDREFRTYFESKGHSIDLQLLGMGDDGHTASLFPGTDALDNKDDRCVANLVSEKDSVRLTLTFSALALSERIVFLIKGESKASATQEVLEQNLHPASQVRARTSTEFWLDEAAAQKLKEEGN